MPYLPPDVLKQIAEFGGLPTLPRLNTFELPDAGTIHQLSRYGFIWYDDWCGFMARHGNCITTHPKAWFGLAYNGNMENVKWLLENSKLKEPYSRIDMLEKIKRAESIYPHVIMPFNSMKKISNPYVWWMSLWYGAILGEQREVIEHLFKNRIPCDDNLINSTVYSKLLYSPYMGDTILQHTTGLLPAPENLPELPDDEQQRSDSDSEESYFDDEDF